MRSKASNNKRIIMTYLIQDAWEGVPDEVCAEIRKRSIIKNIKKNETLFSEGQEADGLYIVKSGLLALIHTSQEGNEQILRLFSGKHFMGHDAYLARDSYHSTAVALIDSQVRYVSAEVCSSMQSIHQEILRSLARYLALELRNSELKLMAMVNKKVDNRVAQAILYLKSRYPNHAWKRREIADFIGATTATVIRVLGRFEKEGLISQKSRSLEILDFEALRCLAIGHGESCQ